MTDATLIPMDDSGAMRTLLTLAVEKGIGVEGIERLTALYERAEARRAATEFFGAMARFQAECPPIAKTSKASVATKAGGSYGYAYAELDEIARTVNPLLARLGLSYTWDSTVTEGMLTCTCTVRHTQGHAVTATFACPVEGSPSMSGPQRGASALTYARRQSLVCALGLTTADPDDDAAPDRGGAVSEEQAANIQALAEEVGADVPAMLKWQKVARVSEIAAANYGLVIAMLERKRSGAKAAR